MNTAPLRLGSLSTHKGSSARSMAATVGTVVFNVVMLCAWPVQAKDVFLDVDEAFELSVQPKDDKSVEIIYAIAPKYYLYRERFTVKAAEAKLAAAQVTPGEMKFDPNLDKTVEVYHGELRAHVPVTQAPSTFLMQITSQGCAEAGLCYPPTTRVVEVSLKGFGGGSSARVMSEEEGQQALARTRH